MQGLGRGRVGTLRPSHAGCAAGALVALVAWVVPAAAGATAPVHPDARAWVVVDARDGEVLAARDSDKPLPVASTTKLMTAFLAVRDLPLSRRIVARAYHPLPAESLMGLRAGEQVTVRSLLYGLLLPSGNDAAVALAQAVAGSVPAFVERMNQAAGRLGLRDTHFSNPIGLDSPGNHSSARDLTALAVLLRRNALFRRIVDTPSADVSGAHPERVVNHNDLLGDVPWIDGVKTGFTPGAGYVLVGSGTRHGVTLVSALLGARTVEARDGGTLDLLRYGFSLYGDARAAVRGAAVVAAHARGALLARDETGDAGSASGDVPGWPWRGGATVTIVILIAGTLARRRGGRSNTGET